jgi:hypothetical protein
MGDLLTLTLLDAGDEAECRTARRWGDVRPLAAAVTAP